MLGELNTARIFAGVVTSFKYLYTFGGQDENYQVLDSIERIDLCGGALFEAIILQNQYLLKQANFIQFPYNDSILIACNKNLHFISFNTELETISESPITLAEHDCFVYVQQGLPVR